MLYVWDAPLARATKDLDFLGRAFAEFTGTAKSGLHWRMTLQWYPGHMTRARRELASLMPSQDVVIEVLDARLPGASSNPVITELRGDKPCIKVLARSDLADAATTRAWLKHLELEPRVRAFASTTEKQQLTRQRIAELCRGLAEHRGADKTVRALIAGVPNVGKSTLVNTLMGRAVANVGDKPAVTKEQQSVRLASGITITDTPGLMWPKIEDQTRALYLGLAGSIPSTAVDDTTLAMFGAALLLERYPELVQTRYKLQVKPESAEALLTEIGRKRGALRKGGVLDLDKASEIFVREFRAGIMGAISLESPPPELVTSP
jgi:ribosome biogenesis GTPase A